MTPARVWADGPGGGTPINASRLNGMEDDIVAAKTDAIADATTKYGGLPALQPVKAVRLEAGKWVWDLGGATHYLFPEPGGGLAVHATAWPVPAATPQLDW